MVISMTGNITAMNLLSKLHRYTPLGKDDDISLVERLRNKYVISENYAEDTIAVTDNNAEIILIFDNDESKNRMQLENILSQIQILKKQYEDIPDLDEVFL